MEPLTRPLAGPTTLLPPLPTLPAVLCTAGPLGLPTEGTPPAPGRKGQGGRPEGRGELETWI